MLQIKMNTNFLLFLILFLFISCQGFAQRYHPRFERVKAVKMSFLVEKSELTAEEEEVFWEIYETFEDNIHKNIRKQLRSVKHQRKGVMDSLSDDKARTIIQELDSIELLQIEEKQKRNKALLEQLPAAKVLKIIYAEEQFKKEMLMRMRNRLGEKNR